MKKVISLVLIASLGLSLMGCAKLKKPEAVRVKCPACGYEFDVPAED